MTFYRAVFTAAVIALLAVLVAAAVQPRPGSRGPDEVCYFVHEPLDLAAGQELVQPLPLREADLRELRFPYTVSGAPATLHVRLSTSDGAVLVDRDVVAPPPRPVRYPALDRDPWKTQGIALVTVPVAGGSRAQLSRLTIFWVGGGTPALLQSTCPEGRPSLVGSDRGLVVETYYGARRPAVENAPTYFDRVAAVAPPWLRGPMPLLVVLAVVVAAAAYVALVIRSGKEASA
jgi:hypothetical protein